MKIILPLLAHCAHVECSHCTISCLIALSNEVIVSETSLTFKVLVEVRKGAQQNFKFYKFIVKDLIFQKRIYKFEIKKISFKVKLIILFILITK